jgi:uncharacterized protein YjbJ (UPF0337 family)
MNWDQVEGKWNQYKGQVKEKWGRLTDDDLDVINGKREQLVGRIQERYGTARLAVEQQVDEFLKVLKGEDAPQGKKRGAGHD